MCTVASFILSLIGIVVMLVKPDKRVGSGMVLHSHNPADAYKSSPSKTLQRKKSNFNSQNSHSLPRPAKAGRIMGSSQQTRAKGHPSMTRPAVMPLSDGIQPLPLLKHRVHHRKDKEKGQFYVGKGNGHGLIRQLLMGVGWEEASNRENADLMWLPASAQREAAFKGRTEGLPEIGRKEKGPPVINWLEGQSQLTNKQRLYRNIARHQSDAIGKYVPLTFIVDFRLPSQLTQDTLNDFAAYAFPSRKTKTKAVPIKNYYADFTINPKNGNINPSLEDCHPDTLWILKPSSANCGRGIHLFASLKQLGKLLSESSLEISVKLYSSQMKPPCYIVQQYIERPLLINGYKFDMRFWMLLRVAKHNGKKTLKVFFFEHGYARLASLKYNQPGMSPNREDSPVPLPGTPTHSPTKRQSGSSGGRKVSVLGNRLMHLTNNAVQKDALQYGKFCAGNQLSLADTLNYLKEQDPKCPLTQSSLRRSVTDIAYRTVSLARQKMVGGNLVKTFQLMGLDFLIGQDYQIWLLEVNNNPCLNDSSPLKLALQRQMLSGLLQLCQVCPSSPTDTLPSGWISLPYESQQ